MAIRVGCAGWSLARESQKKFPSEGTHLRRYAAVFPTVEINSSFYRPHQNGTYKRWADSVPESFRFAVKIPREITHVLRLRDAEKNLDLFLAQAEGLGKKLGPLLVQLPPGLAFEPRVVSGFFSLFRDRFEGEIACEARHPTWFTSETDALLREFRIASVAADPAVTAAAAEPGGWKGFAYYRLHGSPHMYYSAYSDDFLEGLGARLKSSAKEGEAYCIFDNTARDAAIPNALQLMKGFFSVYD